MYWMSQPEKLDPPLPKRNKKHLHWKGRSKIISILNNRRKIDWKKNWTESLGDDKRLNIHAVSILEGEVSTQNPTLCKNIINQHDSIDTWDVHYGLWYILCMFCELLKWMCFIEQYTLLSRAHRTYAKYILDHNTNLKKLKTTEILWTQSRSQWQKD